MVEYHGSQILMVLSVSSANQKQKPSTILQLIAQTSKRSPSLVRSKNKTISSNPLDGPAIASFISNLAPQERLQVLLRGLPLPFHNL